MKCPLTSSRTIFSPFNSICIESNNLWSDLSDCYRLSKIFLVFSIALFSLGLAFSLKCYRNLWSSVMNRPNETALSREDSPKLVCSLISKEGEGELLHTANEWEKKMSHLVSRYEPDERVRRQISEWELRVGDIQSYHNYPYLRKIVCRNDDRSQKIVAIALHRMWNNELVALVTEPDNFINKFYRRHQGGIKGGGFHIIKFLVNESIRNKTPYPIIAQVVSSRDFYQKMGFIPYRNGNENSCNMQLPCDQFQVFLNAHPST